MVQKLKSEDVGTYTLCWEIGLHYYNCYCCDCVQITKLKVLSTDAYSLLLNWNSLFLLWLLNHFEIRSGVLPDNKLNSIPYFDLVIWTLNIVVSHLAPDHVFKRVICIFDDFVSRKHICLFLCWMKKITEVCADVDNNEICTV